jgi:hypothetical protein
VIITEYGCERLGVWRLISYHQGQWARAQGRPFTEATFYKWHKGARQ